MIKKAKKKSVSKKKTWLQSFFVYIKPRTFNWSIAGVAIAIFFGALVYQHNICSNNYKSYENKIDWQDRELDGYKKQIEQLKNLDGENFKYFLLIVRGSEEEREFEKKYNEFLREQLNRQSTNETDNTSQPLPQK